MTTGEFLATDEAGRLAELSRWSNSILVDEKMVRGNIHLLFETAGTPSDQAILNLSNAIDGIERQIDAYADSTMFLYPSLEAEQTALELHYDTVRQLREQFEAARSKNGTSFWSLDGALTSRFSELVTAPASWIASLPAAVVEGVGNTVKSVAVSAASAADSVRQTVVGAFDSVTKPVGTAIKYAPWILGGIAVVLVVGMVAYARVLNSMTGGK